MPLEFGSVDGFSRPDISIARNLGGPGTAGCILRKKGSQTLYLLSNSHVMAWNFDQMPRQGDTIYLLGRDASNPQPIARLADWSPSPDEASPHYIDAAIAELINPSDAAIALIDRPTTYSFTIQPGMRVHITGAKSGKRKTTISGETVPFKPTLHGGAQLAFDVDLKSLVLCDANASTDEDGVPAPFSTEGDSGSAVYDNSGALIGIIVGGTDSGSVFCRIEYIFKRFPLTLP